MDRTITLTIDGDQYVAVPASEYRRLRGLPDDAPAAGMAGRDVAAYGQQQVGKGLRAARDHVGMTQAALAKRLKITQGSIANIESGRTRVGAPLVGRWMKACGLDSKGSPQFAR